MESEVQGNRDAERALITALAERVLEQTAPEELVLFEDTTEQYFEDPQRALVPSRREEDVGFGLDLTLLTPYVLAVATAVVRFLATTIADTAREDAESAIASFVRRLYRRPPARDSDAGDGRDSHDTAATQGPGPLDPDRSRRVYAVALEKAQALGLAPERADLLATSVVGALALEG